jgi:hypothetical protein
LRAGDRDARFANMMGYTQEELEDNFGAYLKPLAEKQNIDYNDFLAKIKLWYDGFRFENSGKKITLIGANFDSKTGKITDYKIEPNK